MRETSHQPASGTAAPQAETRGSLYQDVTDRIVRELEQGSVPWVKPWDASGCALGMPRSAATSRCYSGINVLILWDAVIKRGYASQEWLTFRQSLSLGGHVKKGERGTTICYADRFIPKAERARATADGDEPSAVPFLKRFTVFNVEQCEGLPAHIVAPVKPVRDGENCPAAEALIAATGADIREGGGEAYYHRSEDFIRLPPRARFVSPEDYYCTALHELGHWTAHPARLNRDLQHRFGTSAYAREELIAELSSAFLCAHLGITPQVRHADYLAHWLDLLKDDPRAIFHAASHASKASDFLLAVQTTGEAVISPAEAAE
jgi:antirestriction protein ArdC